MKFYEHDTVFTFGKYKGKQMGYVLFDDPDYISWCIINLDHFFIEERILYELAGIAQVKLSDEAKEVLKLKYERFMEYEDDDNYDDYFYPSDFINWEKETFDALTDGQYGDYDDYGGFGDMDRLRDALGF